MATTCTSKQYQFATSDNAPVYATARQCVNPKTYDVDVSINVSAPGNADNLTRRYWRMSLQRYTSGAWKEVGSRTGYVSKEDPSNRTFTNVGQAGSSMRVETKFYTGTNQTGYVFILTTPFTR